MSERQTQVSNEQTKAALKQAGISHQSLLSERFQKGAEMLGSNTISVRLGGIYALKRIARDDPDIYHVQVMELFARSCSIQPSLKQSEISRARKKVISN